MTSYHQTLIKIKFLFVFFIVNASLFAQETATISLGDSLYIAAKGRMRVGQFDAARHLLGLAEKACRNPSGELYFRIKKSYARIFYLEGKLSNMRSSLASSIKESISHHSDSSFEYAMIIHEKGIYHLGSAQLDSAIFCIKLALDVIQKSRKETDSEYVKYLNDLGVVFYRQNRFSEAIKYYSKSRDLKLAKSSTYDGVVAMADLNIGQVYLNYGDYDVAIDLFERALDFYIESGQAYHRNVAQIYANLGICYSRKSYFKKAITYQEKAIEVWSSLFGPNHAKVAYGYKTIAYSYDQSEDFANAWKYIKEAVRILEELPERSELEYIQAQITKAIIEMDSKNYEEAIRTNQSLIQKYQGSNLKDQLTNVYHNLAIVYNLIGDGEKAEELSKNSILLNEQREKSPRLYEKIYQNLIVANTIQGAYEKADSLIGKAISYGGATSFSDLDLANSEVNSTYHIIRAALRNTIQAFRETGDRRWLEKGRVYIGQLESSLGSQIVKLVQSEMAEVLHRQHTLNGLMLTILFESYQATGDMEYLERFIQVQDNGKSNLILSNILKNDAYASNGVPDSLAKLEKQLTLNIAVAKNRKDLDQSLTLYKRLDSVRTAISSYRRNYEALTLERLDLQRVQSTLLSNEALIQFSIVDSLIYTSIVTNNDLNLIQLKSSFLEDLSSQLDALKQKNINNLSCQTLIKPIMDVLPQRITALHFVRDGGLNLIPFEIFKGKENRYLIEDYAISNQLSFSHYLHAKQQRTGYGKILAFNPTFSGERILASNYNEIIRGSLDPLRGAEEETSRLVNDFDAIELSGENATETAFRNQMDDFNYLHFATHAIIDDANPEYSKLVLSPDSLSDGYLHAYELHSMNVSSELVTLSACNTGFGQVRAGEGAMSLAHAFSYAGAPNILMSLWPVNDQSTAELMSYFYENLNEGMRKNEALRQAKLTFLKNADPVKAHPYYWAGFVISGSPEPINFGKSSYLTLYLIIGGLVLAIGMIYFKSSRSF